MSNTPTIIFIWNFLMQNLGNMDFEILNLGILNFGTTTFGLWNLYFLILEFKIWNFVILQLCDRSLLLLCTFAIVNFQFWDFSVLRFYSFVIIDSLQFCYFAVLQIAVLQFVLYLYVYLISLNGSILKCIYKHNVLVSSLPCTICIREVYVTYTYNHSLNIYCLFCNFELFLNSALKEFWIQEFWILGFQLLDSEFCTFFWNYEFWNLRFVILWSCSFVMSFICYCALFSILQLCTIAIVHFYHCDFLVLRFYSFLILQFSDLVIIAIL